MTTHTSTADLYVNVPAYIYLKSDEQTDTMWIGYGSEKIQTSLFYICCCFFISIA